MIGQVWEFLFCPMHGLLRPDNLSAILTMVQQGWTSIQILIGATRKKLNDRRRISSAA